VVKERSKVMEAMAPPGVGFSMRSTLGSIKQYAHENDMRRLVARHSDEADSFHLDLHHFCVLATTFSDESQEFSMFYATPYMLLTTLRVVISEWPLNVFVDLTHGFCANKVKMIGYGVNTIGWKFMPIMMGTIPDNPGEPGSLPKCTYPRGKFTRNYCGILYLNGSHVFLDAHLVPSLSPFCAIVSWSRFLIPLITQRMTFFLYHHSIQTVLTASISLATSIRKRCLTWYHAIPISLVCNYSTFSCEMGMR
jgi:hypothetical protein